MRNYLILFVLFCSNILFSQNNHTKKILDHKDLVSWNKVDQVQISQFGNYILYRKFNEINDPKVLIYNKMNQKTFEVDRAHEARFYGEKYAVMRVKIPIDTLRQLKRKKVGEMDYPKDTCYLVQLDSFKIEKINNLKSWKVTESDSGNALCIHLEPMKKSSIDSTTKKKIKAESKENGSPFIVFQNLNRSIYNYVKEYSLAEKQNSVLFLSTGTDSMNRNQLYYIHSNMQTLKPQLIVDTTESIKNPILHPSKDVFAFLQDADSSKTNINRKYQLFYGNGKDLQKINTDYLKSAGYILSDAGMFQFNPKTNYLLYSAAKPLAIQDTNIVPDEIVNVEVWNSLKGKLYTQQNVDADKDKKKAFTYLFDPSTNKSYPITNEAISNFRNMDSLDITKIYLFENNDYIVQSSWEGRTKNDVYITNVLTNSNLIGIKGLINLPNLSPSNNFLVWFNPIDTTWNSYHIANNQFIKLTNNQTSIFYDPENDVPDYPNAFGIASWLKDDASLLIYDEYDIWKIDPTGNKKPYRITNGREIGTAYRYIPLDKQINYINCDSILLHSTDKNTYEEGYSWYSFSKNKIIPIIKENLSFSTRLFFDNKLKSLIFTKESFSQFPDLQLVDRLDFKNAKKISDVNPQQDNYNWGKIELVKWIGNDGKFIKGLLVKPSNFDPNKKYPMLVNFYEKESDNILNYRAPEPYRSSINYPFYASRGYVIFNPDISYQVGHPGKSALDAVESGVKFILNQGFVDPNRVGIQGHSWGGYQIAYILTKSKLFKCAESGAPVVNMTSAYGGIRWETGLSRMFQYEKAQSRLGATLWENRDLYLENSPLFEMDKVTTPVLIMSNDKDGHVPWYQGIEYFMALRRLGKPAWLLNYNGEPHWPLKLQNRIDFNIRMQQYFDYYLKDYNMPAWMKDDMKAYEKGIIQGY